MATLRSYRLLNSVEAGITLGSALETLLSGSAGRTSEMSALLSTRGNSRRMAGSSITITAFVNSPTMLNIIFGATTSVTSAACTAVTASPIAMASVANNYAALQIVSANSVSWGIFINSTYYEVNVRTVLC